MTQTEILTFLGSPLLNVIVIPLLLWLGRSILARAVDNVVEKVIERLETRIGAVETDMKSLRNDFSAHDQIELDEGAPAVSCSLDWLGFSNVIMTTSSDWSTKR